LCRATSSGNAVELWRRPGSTGNVRKKGWAPTLQDANQTTFFDVRREFGYRQEHESNPSSSASTKCGELLGNVWPGPRRARYIAPAPLEIPDVDLARREALEMALAH
jgi:hypothetical protein